MEEVKSITEQVELNVGFDGAPHAAEISLRVVSNHVVTALRPPPPFVFYRNIR